MSHTKHSGPSSWSLLSEKADKQIYFPFRSPGIQWDGPGWGKQPEVCSLESPEEEECNMIRKKNPCSELNNLLLLLCSSPFVLKEVRKCLPKTLCIFMHVFPKNSAVFSMTSFFHVKCQNCMCLSAPKLFIRLKCSYLRSSTLPNVLHLY